MACCSLKCLKCFVFLVAVTICALAGLGPIIVGAVYYNERLVTALELEAQFLGTCLFLGFTVILFSFLGICGACKANRYCLFWYFIFLLPVFFFSLGLLAFFIALVSEGEDQLSRYCHNQSNNSNYSALKKFTAYDTIIQNVGNSDFLCAGNCLCDLPSSSFTYMYSYYQNLSTVPTQRSLTRGINGFKQSQDCSVYSSKYDRAEKAVIEIMGEVERQFDCSGICYTSNLSVAYDSTLTVYQTKFNNRQGSCFKKLVDYVDEEWVAGIGFFTALCVVVLSGIIMTCCICFHEELRNKHEDGKEENYKDNKH